MFSPNLRQTFLNNQWWGKVLGGLFGFLIAGPAGGVFGVIVGNFFDRGLASHLLNPHIPYFKKEKSEIRQVFFTELFKALGCLAKSDGKVSNREIEFASFIMKQLKLSKYEKYIARSCFKEGKHPSFDLYKTLTAIITLCRNKPPLLQLFVETSFQMGVLDPLTASKKEALNLVFTRLGYKPYFKHDDTSSYEHRFENNYKQHQTLNEILEETKPNDYHLLGISPNASLSALKKAYRKKMSLYHPDKLIAENAPKAKIKKATQKAQQIQKAYERLKKKMT